jgi:hypothetical protein
VDQDLGGFGERAESIWCAGIRRLVLVEERRDQFGHYAG